MPRRSPPPAGADPLEFASRDEIASVQLARLRWSIRHAYDNVAPFRAKCGEAGVHPDDLASLDDLTRFPFTTKDDLRQAYPFGLFAVPRAQVVRIHASSGTTGKPTVVGYTLRDIETWAALMARSLRTAGARPGDIVHVTHGYGLFTGGLGVHYGAERLQCTVVPMSGGQTERQVQLIVDFQPQVIVATPSYMVNILDECARQGVDPRRTSLAIGIFGAEPWTDAMRADIETRADLDAADLYGLSEVIGPGVACEAVESKDGPAIWEDHFYPEIVDPETGAALADGAQGELVLTSLTKEALPVIRYRTRDRTALLPPTSRSMRRLARVAGRTDDMLIIRGVNLFPSQIEALILGQTDLAPHYVLEVRRDGALDALTVNVESTTDAAAQPEMRTQAGARLQRAIKSYIGVSAEVVIRDPGTIERSPGKAKRVIDARVSAT